MSLLADLRSYARQARRAVNGTRRIAPQYFSVRHPRARGSAGHVHARLTKGEYWKRRYIPLLASYHRCGYSVTISPSIDFLDSPDKEEFGLWRSPWIRVAARAPRGSIILTDDLESASRMKKRGDRVAFLTAEDYVTDWGPASLALPYMMHPKFYAPEFISLTDSDPGAETRDIRIFFAGNFRESDYDREHLRVNYGVETRLALARQLESTFGDDTTWIRKWEEKTKLSDVATSIVIVDSGKAGFYNEDYFTCLGRAIFFLAMPGIMTPHCHNLPEAISRGCIPIVEKTRWHDPLPFEDGVNCIVFNDGDGFVPAIRRAIQMDDQSIARIRAGVNEIWEKYFVPSSIVARVNSVISHDSGALPVIRIKPAL